MYAFLWIKRNSISVYFIVSISFNETQRISCELSIMRRSFNIYPRIEISVDGFIIKLTSSKLALECFLFFLSTLKSVWLIWELTEHKFVVNESILISSNENVCAPLISVVLALEIFIHSFLIRDESNSEKMSLINRCHCSRSLKFH